MRTILVTGATGFIGNYVVNELLKNNHRVIASSLTEAKARSFDWYKRVVYVPFDLSSFDDNNNYYSCFHRPDAMIHLAWEGLPNYKSAFHLEINLPRHFAFLHNLLQHGLKDISVTGTCFEYGMQEGQLSEEMPSAPTNPYAQAKDNLQKQLSALQSKLYFNFKWIRLFYMYGPGQNPNALFSQLEKAIAEKNPVFNMSGGMQVRDYLPVQQVAALIVKIAMQDRVEGVVNCCSGIPVTVNDMVEKYLEHKHFSMRLNKGYYPYPDYEPMKFWGDTKKLNTIINYAD